MSKEVDRSQVFQTTRVRTSLKNDLSWIQISNQQSHEGDNASRDQAAETRPAPVRQKSYVLSTAKKFEPQALTGGLIQNGEAQPEKSVATAVAENKDEHAAATVDQSNIEANEGAAEVSANVHVEEPIQNGEAKPVSSTKENPEAASPVESSAQPVANTTAENKGEYADTAVDQSNVEDSKVKVSADAHVEGSMAETSAAAGTQENKGSAEVPAALEVKLRPQEEPAEPEPINATNLEDAGVESTAQPGGKSCEKCPPVQAAEEFVEALAEVNVESSPETSAVSDAAGGEAALQHSVEPVPDLVAGAVSESSPQLGAETATESSCENGPPEQAAEDTVEARAEVKVESSPETPAVSDAAGGEAALQHSVEPVIALVGGTVFELPTQPAAETAVKSAEFKVDSAAPDEPVLQIRAAEVVKCEVQPVDDTVVEQRLEPTPEDAAGRVVELSIEDAVEPGTASDCEAVAKEMKLNQQSDHTDMYSKAVCSVCGIIIDGHVKITLSEPLMRCHPDCLKCGVCAKALGDLLTPMFLHNQVIQCDGCFAKAL
ncbi:zinc finger protein 185 [Chelmon rostratus]|uniref:zinc finger protein 185 n=1 Tax=Chelmon rostratus TaxID=109905 RepID=UPI001BE5A2E8|nr:zinc finger protein 185 [Chelmon rostratus]